ncbi:MAG: S41 family peptidase, partial [Anaerolineae bacterium]
AAPAPPAAPPADGETAPAPPTAPPADGETAPADPATAEADATAPEVKTAPEAKTAPKTETEGEEPPLRVQIDLEGISERVIALPVPTGRYHRVRGISGKILFSSYPAEGTLGNGAGYSTAPAAKGRLEVYDLEDQRQEVLVDGVSDFEISHDGKTMIYRAGNHLRVLKAGDKPEGNSGGTTRRGGWLDLDRVRLSVEPHAEWEQMYREAWRLQRDHFWTEDMSGVDWHAVYARYLPLLQRVATRSEFSDLMWEMQGELGTSHAYEYGGDYPPEPSYDQGFLGADFRYDDTADNYELMHIVNGDVWDHANSAPLQRLGINLKVGNRLVAVNGRKVGRENPLGEMLVYQAGNEVFLTFERQGAETPTMFSIKTLHSEFRARYREWVETNRRRVHEATEGRVGYVHIPDMGARGYAEFHRGYLAEIDRPGLIVDVRFNGGGHVSQLILEKLARRRLGYDVSRWGTPVPYPRESVMGPMVAIANEQAGSDGDMFCHAFKLMKLGPLVGKRTWGGVIGLTYRDSLVDGGITTQPEFSFWFEDVEWGVENYGTNPDIEVEIRPQDYLEGHDPQLARALQEIMQTLSDHPPTMPDFGKRPKLPLPILSPLTIP